MCVGKGFVSNNVCIRDFMVLLFLLLYGISIMHKMYSEDTTYKP